MEELTQQEQREIRKAEALVRRRKVLAQHITDEVLDVLSELFDVKHRLFMFTPQLGGQYEPLEAMRYDTLRGSLDAIRFERSTVAEAEESLAILRQRINEKNRYE